MFGYATNETQEMMPLTIVLAHKLNKKIAELRRSGELPWARPDSKTQVHTHTYIYSIVWCKVYNNSIYTLHLKVTVQYQENKCPVPIRVHTIVISVQHVENMTNDQIEKELDEKVIQVRT